MPAVQMLTSSGRHCKPPLTIRFYCLVTDAVCAAACDLTTAPDSDVWLIVLLMSQLAGAAMQRESLLGQLAAQSLCTVRPVRQRWRAAPQNREGIPRSYAVPARTVQAASAVSPNHLVTVWSSPVLKVSSCTPSVDRQRYPGCRRLTAGTSSP